MHFAIKALADGSREIFTAGIVTYVDVEVGPAEAAVLLEYNTNNRTKNQAHMKSLAAAMVAGEWIDNVVDVAFDQEGAMVNGQHSLGAVVYSGVTIVLRLTFGMPALARVSYDSGRGRTSIEAADMANLDIKNKSAVRSLRSALLTLPLDQALSGSAKIPNRTAGSQMRNAQYVGWLQEPGVREYANEIASKGRALSISYGSRKPARLAPSQCSWLWALLGEVNPEGAAEFFETLSSGRRAGRGDVFLALDTALDSLQTSGNRVFDQWVEIALVVTAWNAWIKGESRGFLRSAYLQVNREFPKPLSA